MISFFDSSSTESNPDMVSSRKEVRTKLTKRQGRMARKFPGVENGVSGVSWVAEC